MSPGLLLGADLERETITMTDLRSLHVIFSFLCTLSALFSFLRLVSGRRRLSHFDAEKEVGDGMMAIGMLFMLAPVGWLSADLLDWNMLLFAATSLWWICRLFVRKPLLALLLKKTEHDLLFNLRSDLMSCMWPVSVFLTKRYDVP
jgi:hypothetical protein